MFLSCSLYCIPDRQAWNHEHSVDFFVDSARQFVDSILLHSTSLHTRCVRIVLIKVNVFVSILMQLDRLPTIFNISRRGMGIPSLNCVVTCDDCVES